MAAMFPLKRQAKKTRLREPGFSLHCKGNTAAFLYRRAITKKTFANHGVIKHSCRQGKWLLC